MHDNAFLTSQYVADIVEMKEEYPELDGFRFIQMVVLPKFNINKEFIVDQIIFTSKEGITVSERGIEKFLPWTEETKDNLTPVFFKIEKIEKKDTVIFTDKPEPYFHEIFLPTEFYENEFKAGDFTVSEEVFQKLCLQYCKKKESDKSLE